MIRLLLAFAMLCAFSSVAHGQPEGEVSARETAVLEAINRARADPAAYADALRRYRSYFDGRILRLPGNPVGILTTEGVSVVDEAIAFLEQQQPLPPFGASPLLARAADDHVREQGPRGALWVMPRKTEPEPETARKGKAAAVMSPKRYPTARPTAAKSSASLSSTTASPIAAIAT